MSALSEMLQQANVHNWPTEELTSRMRDRGHLISRDTVWRYTTGRVRVVKREYLQAFADVLPGLTIKKMEAAGAVPADLGEWTPPQQSRYLNSKERHALDTLIKSLAANRGEATGGEPQVVVATGDLTEVPASEAPRVHEQAEQRRQPKRQSRAAAGAARRSTQPVDPEAEREEL